MTAVFSAHAPGRVELLGNHTDYNEGYVLSAAIDRGVTINGSLSGGEKIALSSETMSQNVEVALAEIDSAHDLGWAKYPLGVVDIFLREGFPIAPFNASIASDLPLGAGLSSSAAVEVATATLLKNMFALEIEPLQLAKLCRRAENEFVGVNCGLLDQVSSVFGKKGHAIFLDCREETVTTVAFPEGVELLITHSGVKHALTGGEYNERRVQCFEAAERLGVRALRDVTSAQLQAAALPDLLARRAAHIVGENERVRAGVDLLTRGEVERFGALMFASHESSRVNFENSTPELDALVAIARKQIGVLGSRLTGGGFGGATVSLVRRDAAEEIAEAFRGEYREKTGHVCQTYLCEIADGAR